MTATLCKWSFLLAAFWHALIFLQWKFVPNWWVVLLCKSRKWQNCDASSYGGSKSWNRAPVTLVGRHITGAAQNKAVQEVVLEGWKDRGAGGIGVLDGYRYWWCISDGRDNHTSLTGLPETLHLFFITFSLLSVDAGLSIKVHGLWK